MAGIGSAKGSGSVNDERTFEELINLHNEVANNIRHIINGRKDSNLFSKEDRDKLRIEYAKLAQYAKKLSERSTNENDSQKYLDEYKKALKKAEDYGALASAKIPTTTFDDVKGLDNVKKLVKSFMFMAQNPDVLKHYKLNGGLGMMMYGAPGTGKTMFAEAIANAMQLPLFVVTPADIFKSYVGESEASVKNLFLEMDACPDGAILFIDECESIFSERKSDNKDYKASVTTELLQRINGFGVNGSKRILIGATNRPEMIDKAYLRYKRFSHLIHITPPDEEARRAIIYSKLGKVGTDEEIELEGITREEVVKMSRHTRVVNSPAGSYEEEDAFYSAADLCGVIEEACRLALEKMEALNTTKYLPITREMFEAAFNKIPPSISKELLDEYENFRNI